MRSIRFRNIIVFGDSLSDTGIMARSLIGKLSSAMGAMTVSPTGRFSDCRNWTDHMFEAATNGQSLVQRDALTSKRLTQNHQSISSRSKWERMNDCWFRYANYAVGGATGGSPHNFIYKATLTSMKDEVKAFRKDYQNKLNSSEKNENFLFFIWFGANDLYTAGLPPSQMHAVAEKIAKKRRKEITDIVGADRASFVYINMGLPLSAARYQKQLQAVTEKYERHPDKIEHKNSLYKTRMSINNFESGAMLFNNTLRNISQSHGDVYVDMAPTLTQGSILKLLERYHLEEGVQTVGTSKIFIDSSNYKNVMGPKSKISTSDEAHPTDRVYRLIWEKIRDTLLSKGYTFGALPENSSLYKRF